MLNGWTDFYTTTGAAGGTLVGLLFVVVTLGTSLSVSRRLDIAHASLTPAMYSFAGVLLQSMIMLVPWQSDLPCGILLCLMGAGGLIYRIRAVRVRSGLHLRAIKTRVDRLLHNATPIAASVVLMCCGAGLIAGEAYSPFVIAGSTTLFLVSGVYRTWGETLALIELSDKA
jgi:hypothetical protein